MPVNAWQIEAAITNIQVYKISHTKFCEVNSIKSDTNSRKWPPLFHVAGSWEIDFLIIHKLMKKVK